MGGRKMDIEAWNKKSGSSFIIEVAKKPDGHYSLADKMAIMRELVFYTREEAGGKQSAAQLLSAQEGRTGQGILKIPSVGQMHPKLCRQ